MASDSVAAAEPGSFRDPDSRVFVAEEHIYRALSERGAADWAALRDSQLLGELLDEGLLVGTREVPTAEAPAVLTGDVALILEHERIPFISYPYEWTFSMLRDAALLQLDVLLRAIDAGLMLKDSSSYNVQFRGTQPVFIDVGSFERLREGEPWVGYRQFCMLYLYPLLFEAHRGIPFQPWLRGSVDGITPAEAAAVFSSWRDRLRRGVLTNVRIHSRMEARHSAQDGDDVQRDLKKAGFSTELVKANVSRLRKLVAGLHARETKTQWTSYGTVNTYSDADRAAKVEFVDAAAGRRRRRLVWDVGANDAAYSQVALPHADYVVALDSDAATVDAVYRGLHDAQERRLLTLVGDVTDPSPGLGWAGRERQTLTDRGRPDLILALAVIHHISITGNVPIREVVAWLADLGADLVIEFPTREDPMVRSLLSGKREGTHPDYERASFERALAERFAIERTQELPSGTRVLYEARPAG